MDAVIKKDFSRHNYFYRNGLLLKDVFSILAFVNKNAPYALINKSVRFKVNGCYQKSNLSFDEFLTKINDSCKFNIYQKEDYNNEPIGRFEVYTTEQGKEYFMFIDTNEDVLFDVVKDFNLKQIKNEI